MVRRRDMTFSYTENLLSISRTGLFIEIDEWEGDAEPHEVISALKSLFASTSLNHEVDNSCMTFIFACENCAIKAEKAINAAHYLAANGKINDSSLFAA